VRRSLPLLLAALAGLILLPATAAPAGALAADLTTGPAPAAKRAFSVALDIRYDGNRPKAVTKFKFKNVVVTCEEGPAPNPFTTDSKRPHFGPMSVNDQGRFGRVFSNSGQNFNGKVVIRGEFLTRRKLEGTLKIAGDYPNDGYEGCTSGKLEWAARVG